MLVTKKKSLDVLLKVDSGRDIGSDGEDTGGAIDYFEKLCQQVGNDGVVFKRDPILVINWWVLLSSVVDTQ